MLNFMKKLIIITILTIIILAIIGGGVFWYFSKYQGASTKGQGSENQPAEIVNIEDLSSIALATEDWQTYRNEEYGFELKYPREWEIQQNLNLNGSPLIVRSKEIIGNDQSICQVSIWVLPTKIGIGLNLTEVRDEGFSQIINNMEFNKYIYIDNDNKQKFISLETNKYNKWYTIRYFLLDNSACGNVNPETIVNTFSWR